MRRGEDGSEAGRVRARACGGPTRVTGALLLLVVGWSVSAAAQAPARERPVRRVEVTIGGGLIEGTPLGSLDAELRPATGQPAFRLFATETRLEAAPLVEVRLGTALTRRFGVEVRAAFNRPELRTSVTDDVEEAPPLTVVERIDQYFVEGGVLVMLDELRLGPMVPFATAGAGYLRQLHEGLAVMEEGHLYHAGGGIKLWLFTRPRGAIRAAGLRADTRVYHLVGGYALEEGPRRPLAVSGGFFLTF